MRLYFIIFLVLFTAGNFYAQKKDTLIRTFWNNGNQKTVTVYKLKRVTDNTGQTITVLSDVKSIKYYKDENDIEEEGDNQISKKEFDVLNRQRAEGRGGLTICTTPRKL